MVRKHFYFSGRVQGVGFRPFIHRLVERHGLSGWVRNTSEGAELEVEGVRGEVEAFVREIGAEAPPLAPRVTEAAALLADAALTCILDVLPAEAFGVAAG